jgi:uncharacterized membrane protein
VGTIVLSEANRKRISAAIKAAEVGHRGEIVVHVEPRLWGKPLERAAKLFTQLGVHNTKDDTGVLLYVATATRAAAVWAGKGVRGGADSATWKSVFAALGAASDPTSAICDAIAALGKVLTTHASGADVHGNELGDGVSA